VANNQLAPEGDYRGWFYVSLVEILEVTMRRLIIEIDVDEEQYPEEMDQMIDALNGTDDEDPDNDLLQQLVDENL